MFDDPRWGDDPRDRDDERRDRDDDWQESGDRKDLGDSHRDRDDDSRQLGRGPGSNDRDSHDQSESRDRSDQRGPERDRDVRDRGNDPRDAFTRHLDLPRGRDREIVQDARGREYTLRGSESRSLSTVGAFRIVPARELRERSGRAGNPRDGDLRHLREQGLIETVRVHGHRDVAVTLTDRGRQLLESRRSHGHEPLQAYYAGIKRERELEHDSQIHEAYTRVADRLAERGAHVERVALDYELKREYQQWLHQRDGHRDDYDGHPDRDDREIQDWAADHDLPYFDGQVHFPDLRIEYRDADGRYDHEDVEVVTVHYRGAHCAAVARSGFSCHRGSSARIGSGGGGGSRGAGHHGGLAEELWD
jgi:DNA-binding MarR family transcriptional regulator